MHQNTFKPFDQNELPAGFSYPIGYLKLSQNLNSVSSIPYFNWWFVDAVDSLKETIEIYYHLTGHNDLIEFTRDGDWAACFDANDVSGDPKVFVYDLGNKENSYEMVNFDTWLKSVIDDIQLVNFNPKH